MLKAWPGLVTVDFDPSGDPEFEWVMAEPYRRYPHIDLRRYKYCIPDDRYC